jgi:uncharacterized membrane protein YbhN (UPF0104 family)
MLQRLHTAARWLEQMPLALSLLAIAIAAAVSWLMADAAGLHAVARVIRRAEPEWLALLLGARAVSFGGYTLAHRRTLTPGDKRKVPIATVLKMVAFAAAATSLEGGFSIDRRALRGVGATDRQATVAVLNLGALELATLAPAAWICSLALLDTPHVQEGVTLPWAIGVPTGLALALLAVWKLSPRSLARKGAVGRALGHALEALQLLLEQIRRAPRYLEGWVGMGIYWTCEIVSLWAALRMFGVHASVAVAVVAYATGHVLTPRSLPLSGVGLTEVLLPLALMWTGIALAAAVPAVFSYRLALLALSIPPAIAAREHVRRLVTTRTAARRVGSG